MVRLLKHKLDKTALRIFKGIYKKYAPVFEALANNEVEHMVHRIKPLYKKDSFGRPLGVNVDKPSWKYVWLPKGVTSDEPEGWYYIDNSEGEPAWLVDYITIADNDDWKTNSRDYRDKS